jgi:hypothetical protein
MYLRQLVADGVVRGNGLVLRNMVFFWELDATKAPRTHDRLFAADGVHWAQLRGLIQFFGTKADLDSQYADSLGNWSQMVYIQGITCIALPLAPFAAELYLRSTWHITGKRPDRKGRRKRGRGR